VSPKIAKLSMAGYRMKRAPGKSARMPAAMAILRLPKSSSPTRYVKGGRSAATSTIGTWPAVQPDPRSSMPAAATRDPSGGQCALLGIGKEASAGICEPTST
jgi:hypothetical protein